MRGKEGSLPSAHAHIRASFVSSTILILQWRFHLARIPHERPHSRKFIQQIFWHIEAGSSPSVARPFKSLILFTQ